MVTNMKLLVLLVSFFTLAQAVDVNIESSAVAGEMEKEGKEIEHIKVVRLNEASILKEQMYESAKQRLLTMLIAVSCTILPVCCCICVCRRIIDPNKAARQAAMRYAPGVEEDEHGNVKYRALTEEEQQIMDEIPERMATSGKSKLLGKGIGKKFGKGVGKQFRSLKKGVKRRSPKKMIGKLKGRLMK